MGYGGILSGLVQGYGQAVIGKEKRDYEEKQKQKQNDLAMYQAMLANASTPEQSAWAWQKYDEVAHGTGGKASSKPSILGGIGKMIFGGGGGQQQSQQGSPGGQQAPAAPQSTAQPVNPQGSAPTAGQPQPGMAASPGLPVSTTPVVRPQLTPPLPPRQQAQAGQQQGLTPPGAPNFAAWQASADARKQAQSTAALRSEEEIKLSYQKQLSDYKEKNDEQFEAIRHKGDMEKENAILASKTITSKGVPDPEKPWISYNITHHPDGTETKVESPRSAAVQKDYVIADSLSRTSKIPMRDAWDAIQMGKLKGMDAEIALKDARLHHISVEEQQAQERINKVKGSRIASGALKPHDAEQIEDRKDRELHQAEEDYRRDDERAQTLAAKGDAPSQAEANKLWKDSQDRLARRKTEVQQNYEKSIRTFTGASAPAASPAAKPTSKSNTLTPPLPQRQATAPKIAKMDDVKAFAATHGMTPEQAKKAFTDKGYVIQ